MRFDEGIQLVNNLKENLGVSGVLVVVIQPCNGFGDNVDQIYLGDLDIFRMRE